MALLTEKYRPQKIEDLVFIDDDYENKFKEWIKNGEINTHILLYGLPGLGKSSAISVLINELNITDSIRYNMSDKTSIDDMRKVIDFASVSPMIDKYKYIILEEFERASPQAQDSLKFVLDQYSEWCRFIFTTNNISKISSAIQSRCQAFHFKTLKFESFVKRIANILIKENIKFNPDDVVKYVNSYYPDLRACINSLDQRTIDGVLQPFSVNTVNSGDKYELIVSNIFKLNLLQLKELLSKNISNDEYLLLYEYMWNHVEKITDNVDKYDSIIRILSKYVYQHEFVALPDLNFAGCIVEIKHC